MSKVHRNIQSYNYSPERKLTDIQRDAHILNIAINQTKLDLNNLSGDHINKKKFISKPTPIKRSRSNGRGTPDLHPSLTISSRMQGTIQNSRVWPFQDRENSRQTIDVDKKRTTGFKNLDVLLTPEKSPNTRKTKAVLQPLSDRYEDMTWKKLPKEFQKNPLFQAIYTKRKNEEKELYTTLEVANNAKFKPQLSVVQTSAGLKPLNHIPSGRRMRTLPDQDPCYYEMSTIGYQNYAFRKLPPKRMGHQQKHVIHNMADIKIPLEHFLNNISSQQKILSKLPKDSSLQDTREILKREVNRSNKTYKTTETYVESVAAGSRIENENKYSLGADLINEIEPNNTFEDSVSSKGRVPLKVPRDYRITMERSKSVIPERKHNRQLSSNFIDKSRNNSVISIKFADEWKEEFDLLSSQSAKLLNKQKDKVAMREDLDSSSSEIHFINNALKEIGISLKLFVESQRVLSHQKKFIVDRILLSLGLNPSNELSMVTWEKFCAFKQILVSKDAPVNDIINFMIKFFKVDENEELKKEKFILVLKSINEKVDSHRTIVDLLNSSYHVLLENFRIFGIIKEGEKYIDFEAFKDVFLKNKMNILDLIDLISSIN